jgi:hypothetical protein
MVWWKPMTNPTGDEEFQKFLFPVDILKRQFPASGMRVEISVKESPATSAIAPFISDLAAWARPSHASSADGAVALRSGARQVVRVARERGSGALLSCRAPFFPR